jgi:hypothetical protein
MTVRQREEAAEVEEALEGVQEGEAGTTEQGITTAKTEPLPNFARPLFCTLPSNSSRFRQ